MEKSLQFCLWLNNKAVKVARGKGFRCSYAAAASLAAYLNSRMVLKSLLIHCRTAWVRLCLCCSKKSTLFLYQLYFNSCFEYFFMFICLKLYVFFLRTSSEQKKLLSKNWRKKLFTWKFSKLILCREFFKLFWVQANTFIIVIKIFAD